MAKRFSSRGLSKHRSYSLEEAALIIGATKPTLTGWGRTQGLEIMTSQRPHMVHGAVLILFLDKRAAKKKTPLILGHFKCMSCGVRGLPLGLMADYIETTPKSGRLSALCNPCERPTSLIVGEVKLAQYSELLEIVYR